ncbi:GNAT family N-acetyltransferase [Bacillus sp. T33-2]|uniref:GNAT family N-acetyltransferase n=1 Tax=Bacillus sp. T33-2 TaxID=2054168 RepID=UPI000C773E86|nr:GNAT family N-acetyltransferase [Bacillus sp. T33-2]PLR91970.1 N-acetyltransferase [Bacillus sp. T33-2]
MKIRLAKRDDLLEVVNILNEVTWHLHSKGIMQWDFPWDAATVAKDINDNYCYVLVDNGKMIGTFAIRNIDRTYTFAIEHQSKYLGQIAILPEFQGIKLGEKVTSFARSLASDAKKPLFLDCWAGNGKLRNFYSDNGFTYLGDFPEDDYMVSVFQYDSHENCNDEIF